MNKVILNSEKNGHLSFGATKLALELTITLFPNFIRNTNFSWKMKAWLKVDFTMINTSVHFVKVLSNRDIC